MRVLPIHGKWMSVLSEQGVTNKTPKQNKEAYLTWRKLALVSAGSRNWLEGRRRDAVKDGFQMEPSWKQRKKQQQQQQSQFLSTSINFVIKANRRHTVGRCQERSAPSAGRHRTPEGNASTSRPGKWMRGDSMARSLAGTLAVGAALQPPGRSARPGRTETFWLTGEEARMEPSERNRIEMTGSRVGATSRCSLSSPQNITHTQTFLPLFFTAPLSLFASSSVPGWRWRKLGPFLLKVREYANKLRGRGKRSGERLW